MRVGASFAMSSFLELPGDFCGAWNQSADVVAIGIDGFIEIAEQGIEFDAVGFLEGALEKRLGNLETDEIVVGVGGVALFGDFEDIEAKFGFQMSGGILRVGHHVAVFLSEVADRGWGRRD